MNFTSQRNNDSRLQIFEPLSPRHTHARSSEQKHNSFETRNSQNAETSFDSMMPIVVPFLFFIYLFICKNATPAAARAGAAAEFAKKARVINTPAATRKLNSRACIAPRCRRSGYCLTPSATDCFTVFLPPPPFLPMLKDSTR